MGKPSEKQIAFANDIANKLKIEVPQEALNDSVACNKFISEHNKPSEKQLEFARKIVDKLDVKAPDYASKKEVGEFLSKYSDEYKASFKK